MVSSSWPFLILSPTLTLALKPSPFISTVSTPTWMSTSTPPAPWMPSACRLSGAWVMTPSTGAKTLPSEGSMPQHLPRMPCAKTSSGMDSIGTMVPLASAATITGPVGTGAAGSSFFLKMSKNPIVVLSFDRLPPVPHRGSTDRCLISLYLAPAPKINAAVPSRRENVKEFTVWPHLRRPCPACGKPTPPSGWPALHPTAIRPYGRGIPFCRFPARPRCCPHSR